MGFIGNAVHGIGSIFGVGNDKGADWHPDLAPIQGQDNLVGRTNEGYTEGQESNTHQDALAQALLAQSQGLGPNPAAAAFQQATNQNQAMTAGNIAAVKGINPALAARMAATQGSNIQQQAAAQGAQMRAQQQLGAQQQLQGIYANQGQQALNQQQIQQQAISGLNNANVANYGQANSSQAGVQTENAKGGKDLLGGVFGAVGKGVSAIAGGGGKMAEGGVVSGPSSNVGQALHKILNVGTKMKAGGKVPGKAEVAGNSYKNDTVSAKLSPGEVVIPRSVMNSDDPVAASAKFVQAVLAKQGMRK